MKRSSIFLMTLTLIMLLCGAAYATEFEARGSAVVTGIISRYVSSAIYSRSIISVTNITGSDVDCRVTYYDHAGNDLNSFCTIKKGSTSSTSGTTIATGINTFELPAGETRIIVLQVTGNQTVQGHAAIEWASEDTHLRKALIASCRIIELTSAWNGFSNSSVNGDQPF